MKKILFLTTCFCAIASGAIAADGTSAYSGIYVAPKFIYSYQTINDPKESLTGFGSYKYGDEHDSTFGGALAIGYDFNNKTNIPVRAELEYAYRSDAEKGSFEARTQTLMLNGFYDFRNTTAFVPYIGGGIGISSVKAKISSDVISASDTQTNFAWNVGLGIHYEVNKNVAIGLGYRYGDFGEAEISKNVGGATYKLNGDMTAHEALVSLKYTF
jgi:opacity protein-like surface antigen